MKLSKSRTVVLVVLAGGLAGVLLTMTACRDSSSASTGDEISDAPGALEAGKPQHGPPADYIRSRCGMCSCRVFMGNAAECTRPSCRHHWQEHQRPPQGG